MRETGVGVGAVVGPHGFAFWKEGEMKNIDTSFLRAANELEGAVLLALLCLLGLRVWERRLWHASAVELRFVMRPYHAIPLWPVLFGFESGTVAM